MRTPRSYLAHLRSELAEIADALDDLIDGSTIRYVNPNSPGSGVWFAGAADWAWGPSDAATSAAQMRLLGQYRAWFDRFVLLFPHPTPAVTSAMNEADEFVRRWITREGRDRSVPGSLDEAKALAAQKFTVFAELLDLAATSGSDVLRVVPDTNALIDNPDLASYARRLPSSTFVVHLVPTVMSELDRLKTGARAPDVRAAAQGMVRRLKGLRDRGSLLAGVKLTETITVRAEAREVDVAGVLDWLDPAVPDDRIVAAALRLQSEHPAGVVMLITSDLNLQNKADAAGLPYVETPPTSSSLRAKLEATLYWTAEAVNGAPPRVALVNQGPAGARDVTYCVRSPAGSPPPLFTSGPWTVPRLDKGASDDREAWGVVSGVVEVSATWVDKAGEHDVSWDIPVPPRPTASVVRHTSRR